MDQDEVKDHVCKECIGGVCRPPVAWRDPNYLDSEALHREMHRVFEVCSNCRMCESLCDSFPRLFNIFDSGSAHDAESDSEDAFKSVVDACTLCDMCYPICPYRPPHDFALDFPSLMVRYRAFEKQQGKTSLSETQLGNIDRNGRLGRNLAPLVNWSTKSENRLGRVVLESLVGIHRDAWLPAYQKKSSAPPSSRLKPPQANDQEGRRVVIYHNCLVEYNIASIAEAAAAVLALNGIDVAFSYPGCCGMPQLERGDIETVSRQAALVSRELNEWIDAGYDVISLIPSCTFMLKTLYPMYLPDDPGVIRISKQVFDICEYVVALASADGLVNGLRPLDGGVTLHVPCHSRSQGTGAQAAIMLRMIPDIDVLVLERCSGHGGTWGIMKSNFELALEVAGPAAEMVSKSGRQYFASECPLGGEHILQTMEVQNGGVRPKITNRHPIEILAMSYGIGEK